jgi:flagellar motor protein MotB
MSNLNVHIPEPCHENWGAMSQAEKGRHCSLCKKTVMDFTGHSQEEFQAAFQKIHASRDTICGRFRDDQLGTEKQPKFLWIEFAKLKLTPLQQFLFAFIFAFFLGGFSACKVGDGTMGVPIVEKDYYNVSRHLESFDRNCNEPGPTMGVPIVAKDSLKKDSVIVLPPKETSELFFDTDSSSLNPSSRKALDLLAAEIKKGKYIVEVIGHTDSRGSEALNKELSLKRATAVKEYLEKQGVKVDICRGAGYQFPVGDNGTEAGRAKNRRVEIIVRKK